MAETEAGRMKTMNGYDFTAFPDVRISGIDTSALSETESDILYALAKYCQAMCDADIITMRTLVSEDMIYTHMSGKKQTREEYFKDIKEAKLCYYTIGIENPVISVEVNKGSVSCTSVLNANAYGAEGTYRMKTAHHYELRNCVWTAVNR